MEPLDSVRLPSQTNDIHLEDVECQTPSPVTSCAGSDCDISAAKAVAAAEAAIEERNDVILRLMGHLMPVSTGPEEGSASETDTSILSSASTLKRRLHSLPTPSEAIKLADRVAVLNRRIRREREIYLHLQSLRNRIEEKDEGDLSTTDSSKTVNSTFNRRQGQINNARARRRERLNSGSPSSQNQMSSDLQLCSPGLSSPEPLTLREIREDLTEELGQLSSEIKAQYRFENDSTMNRIRENIATGLSNSLIAADEMKSSHQNNLHFSTESYTRLDRNVRPAVSSDCDTSTTVVDALAVDRIEMSNLHSCNDNYFADGLTNCNLSAKAENPRGQGTTSSTASSTGADYPYVTRKKTPIKFGGYRPSSGLIFRNLSSDSESDAISDRIVHKGLRSHKYLRGNWTDIPRHSHSKSDGITKVESYSVKETACEDGLLSPVPLTDGRDLFKPSSASQKSETSSKLQILGETGWTSITLNGKNDQLDGAIQSLVKESTSADSNVDHFHNGQSVEESFADPFDKEKGAKISGYLTRETNTENFLNSEYHLSCSRKNHSGIISSLPVNKPAASYSSRDLKALILGELHSPNHGHVPSLKVSGIANHKSVPSHPECAGKSEDLGHREQDDDHEFAAVTNSARIESDDDFTDQNVRPKIPQLEMGSHDCSQSRSLSSEDKRDGTSRSSLDVNALIQALSDVSLKQNSTDCTNRPFAKLRSPLGYGNRFSGSSGPRSSEYTPAGGGSRQSLTSLEVSEAHSMKISQGVLTARRQATPSMKSNDQSARSASRTVSKTRSTPPPNMKKSPIVRSTPFKDLLLENDLSQESRLVPVVAKIDKTNIVCSKHPLRVKSITKLISPRKYPNSKFRGEIANQVTSRTEISRSSVRSRRSFRSLKSVQNDTKAQRKKAGGLQPKTNSTGLSAPVSRRRVLEPLNLVPQIKPELLNSIDRKFERREKTLNDSSEVNKSQFNIGSERTTTASSNRSSSRRSPLSETNRTDLSGPRFPQRLKNSGRSTIRDAEVSSAGTTPEKPSTEQDHELLKNSIKGKKNSRISSRKSSVTSGNVSPPHSERLSLSSGDCEGKMSWLSSPRDKNLTQNDNANDSGGKLYGRKMSEATNPDVQCIELSELTTSSQVGSFGNCVHVNDLQDGREVTLPFGNSRCQEDSLRETELFNRLPNEIIGSLTRHTSRCTKATKDLDSTKETRSTIENLRSSVQTNKDQWMKNVQTERGLEITRSGSAGDKISSTDSFVPYRKSESRNLLSNRTKIPQKIPLAAHDIFRIQLHLQKTVPGNLNSRESSLKHSGPNSRRNSYRSIAESRDDDREVNTPGMTAQNPIGNQSCNFKEEQAVNSERQNIKLCDIEVISNAAEVTIPQLNSPKAPVAMHLSDSTSHPEKHDRKVPSREDDEKTVENMPSKNFGYSDRGCEQSEKQITVYSCEQKTQLMNELKDGESLRYLSQLNDDRFVVCEKIITPNSTRSTKSQIVTQRHQDGITSSSLSIKTSLSMSKLNLSTDSKRDIAISTGANSAKKSQDRFPFTISESASRKASKFKVVTDVNLGQLIHDQSARPKPNNTVPTQNPTISTFEDQKISPTNTVDGEKQTDVNCDQSTTCELTPFLEEFNNEISHDSPDSLNPQTPFVGSNYMSYGCLEEPRSLMPTVKEMVKKLSTKLRYTRTKRCQDIEETKIEILYRNIKCRCESGEGSSSAASLYQSQPFDTSNKLFSSVVRRSKDSSRVSTGKTIKSRRNYDCISMSTQHSPRRGYHQDDLWIQEFDSDSEFDTQPVAYCQKPNDSCMNAKARTSSPENDRYSKFLARRRLSGIMNDSDHHGERMNSVLKCSEGGDSENVHCKKPEEDVDGLVNEVPGMLLKSARIPVNSTKDESITNKFEIFPTDSGLEDSTANSGCCCFRIYHFFVKSKKRGSKTRQRIKARKNKEFS